MPFCANCGTELTGRFCAKCGTPAPATDAGQTAAPPSGSGAAAASTDLPENLVCALTYGLGALTGVLFLVLEPYNANPKIRFHAMQSLFVSGAAFIAWFALLLVSGMLSLIPFLGAIFGSLMLALFGLAILGVWLMLAMKAYQGQMFKLPFLGDLAEKQAYTK